MLFFQTRNFKNIQEKNCNGHKARLNKPENEEKICGTDVILVTYREMKNTES